MVWRREPDMAWRRRNEEVAPAEEEKLSLLP